MLEVPQRPLHLFACLAALLFTLSEPSLGAGTGAGWLPPPPSPPPPTSSTDRELKNFCLPR